MGNRIWRQVVNFKAALRRKGEKVTLERMHAAFIPPGFTRDDIEAWGTPLVEAVHAVEREIAADANPELKKRRPYPVLRKFKCVGPYCGWEFELHPTKGWRCERTAA